MRVTYEDDHVEEFTVKSDETVEWVTKPGTMKLGQRKRFDRITEELHYLMLEAAVKKLEVEEETV